MKNMQLLNISYKYVNRYINAEEFVSMLKGIDKSNLTKKDINETKKFIEDIENIIVDNPNEVDELVMKEKEKTKKMLNKLDQIKNIELNKDSEFLLSIVNNLEHEYDREVDSKDRWLKILDYFKSNKYYTNLCRSLSDYELLEYIAQYIHAKCPPMIDQELFDRLVEVGISKDEREYLWRLAFNYLNSGFNFDKIVDYFIEKKDGYYLDELICAVYEDLDIDSIINKLNDKELIEYIIKDIDRVKDIITDDRLNILKDKLKD